MCRSDQVDKGIYSLVVRATDAGNPPLYSDVKVTVTVGSTGNQKPIFGEENYQVTIKENTPQGTSILNVNANETVQDCQNVKRNLGNNSCLFIFF